jgi:hypothetical protein
MEERDSNLDALKAISISFVIVWHIRPLKFVDLGNTCLFSLLHFAYYGFLKEITVLGVPTFFLVSLYLFRKKQAEDGGYLRKRMSRLIGLCIFWTTVQTVFFTVLTGEMPRLSIESILSGGPELPSVGGSVFYFLWSLALLTAFQYLFLRCGEAFKVAVTIVIFAITLVTFEVNVFKRLLPDNSNILNFLYIVPISSFLSEKQNLFIRHRNKFLALYVLFAVHDFAASKFFEYPWPAYSRISVVVGMITLFCYVMRGRIPRQRVVFLLSKYSLGLFSLHKYFWLLSLWLIHDSGLVPIFRVGLETRPLIVFISAVFLTCVSLPILKRIWLDRVIS